MWKYNFPIKEEPALEKLGNVKFQHTNHESIILVIFLVVINLHHWGGFSEWCMLDKKLVQSHKSYQGSSWKGLASHKSKKSIHMQVKDIDLHNSKERRQWRHKSKTQCWISYKSKLNLVDQFCYKSKLDWVWPILFPTSNSDIWQVPSCKFQCHTGENQYFWPRKSQNFALRGYDKVVWFHCQFIFSFRSDAVGKMQIAFKSDTV